MLNVKESNNLTSVTVSVRWIIASSVCCCVFDPAGCWTVSMTWTKWFARDTRELMWCLVTCCWRLYTCSSHTLWVQTAIIHADKHGSAAFCFRKYASITWFTSLWRVSVFSILLENTVRSNVKVNTLSLHTHSCFLHVMSCRGISTEHLVFSFNLWSHGVVKLNLATQA